MQRLSAVANVDRALGKRNKSNLHHYDGAWHMAQWHHPRQLSEVVPLRFTSLVP
jgi:hypothetical protein